MAALSKSLKAGSKSVFDWGKETKKATEKVKPAIKQTKKLAEVYTAPRVGLNPAMDKGREKAKELRREQDNLRRSFQETINPSEELGEKLTDS